MKERTWIDPVTSKIMKQPLESDADAQLHEERVISVRNKPNLHLEFNTRNVPHEMPSSWKVPDVTKFQEDVKVAQNTIVE